MLIWSTEHLKSKFCYRTFLNALKEGSYSTGMGFVYVSNLIVGTGALTMPLAVANAGLFLSVPLLLWLEIFKVMITPYAFRKHLSSSKICWRTLMTFLWFSQNFEEPNCHVIGFSFDITSFENSQEVTEKPEDGAYIRKGLYF